MLARMGTLVIHCPTDGRPLPTGTIIDDDDPMPRVTGISRVDCFRCHTVHRYGMRDMYELTGEDAEKMWKEMPWNR
jgi:hypothetical protein